MQMDRMGLHPDDLLPWLANGTLTGTERLDTEKHVARCERCRRELAYLESLRNGVAQLDDVRPPGEFGLNRLLRDIHRRPHHAWHRWVGPALAASLAVIVLQGIILVQLLTRSPENIVPLGQTATDAYVLQIRFQPHATEADMRAALQSVHARLIDGPGALGIYRAKLLPADSGKPMAPAHAIEMLASRSNVVMQVLPESWRVPSAGE